MSAYPQEYIDACRSRVARQVTAYERLLATARAEAGSGELEAAIGAFDAGFYDNMVLTLDSYFTHRLRTKEGKDGNPMNEVRVLCSSILLNGGIFTADKTIRLDPAKSLLGYAPGDEIAVDGAGFARLSEAYFAAIEGTFR